MFDAEPDEGDKILRQFCLTLRALLGNSDDVWGATNYKVIKFAIGTT